MKSLHVCQHRTSSPERQQSSRLEAGARTVHVPGSIASHCLVLFGFSYRRGNVLHVVAVGTTRLAAFQVGPRPAERNEDQATNNRVLLGLQHLATHQNQAESML